MSKSLGHEFSESENLHLKRALTPKIRDQEILAYCTWITEFEKQDVIESEF